MPESEAEVAEPGNDHLLRENLRRVFNEQFDPTFSFRPQGVAVGHHGLRALRWVAGPAGDPVAITGTDVAQIVDGRIARLWVLLDQSFPS